MNEMIMSTLASPLLQDAVLGALIQQAILICKVYIAVGLVIGIVFTMYCKTKNRQSPKMRKVLIWYWIIYVVIAVIPIVFYGLVTFILSR